MRNLPSISTDRFSDKPDARALADNLVRGGASARDVGTFMGFLDSIGKEPPAAKERPLAGFTTAELKRELLERGCTDFSRITPWLKCSLLLVIFALVVLTNIGMKCMDGEIYGFACSIVQ